jgi:hypothetical protein
MGCWLLAGNRFTMGNFRKLKKEKKMATWKVQQKVEMWKEAEIEADTYEEAIEKSWDSSVWWEVLDSCYEDQDEFWLENQDTGESYSRSPNGVFKEN